MASILDRYGIKEVADVTFYEIDKATGNPSYPVLYLDTLKVSTIEQTAEEAEARGGKGNAALIAWDYGKDINVTLEDALFSAKSMAIMFGNGTVSDFESYGTDGASTNALMKTIQFKIAENGNVPLTWTGPNGKTYKMDNPRYYEATGKEVTDQVTLSTGVSTLSAGTYFCTFDVKIEGSVIEVSANSFPGTYYVTGDTYARSETSGNDEFFQFIIPKAKVTSENTITLEAEGDPSVFNMNLKVLRPADGVMMKLVKYDVSAEVTSEASESKIYHNHILTEIDSTGKTE